jgi:hypothetical protein
MPEKPVTQEQFDEFKKHLDTKFDDLKQTLTPIVDPATGVFIRLAKTEDATEAAHKRLDGIHAKAAGNTSILKGENGNPGLVDEVREIKKFKAILVKIIWIMITPILGAIAFGLWAILSKQ